MDYSAEEDVERKSFYENLLAEGATPEGITGEESVPGEDPLEAVLAWAQSEYGDKVAQEEVGAQLAKHWQVSPPESCASCHR